MTQKRFHYTPGETADLFGVDPKTVATWADEGRLTAIRTPGGHRRFPVAEINALVRMGGFPDDEQDSGLLRQAIEAFVTQTFNGDGTAALLAVAEVYEITVACLDRAYFAEVMGRRGHVLTDEKWKRISERLGEFREVINQEGKVLLTRYVLSILAERDS
jgi:excisionase family DNA binding protein